MLVEDPIGGGRVDIDDERALTTVHLHGEIDAASTPLLHDLLHQCAYAGHPVTIELGALTFMDSAGLNFLARLVTTSAPARVTLAHPGPQVTFLLQRTGLEQLFDITTA